METTLRDHLKKAGRSRSEKKRQAVIRNLEKARAAKANEAELKRLRAIAFPNEQQTPSRKEPSAE